MELRHLRYFVAVAEELEASLEVVAQMLARLDVPGNLIEPLLDVFRRESVSLRPLRAPRTPTDSLTEALRHTPVSTHRVEPDHWCKGHSIGELNLRANTHASVIAIQRGKKYITAPSAAEELQEEDDDVDPDQDERRLHPPRSHRPGRPHLGSLLRALGAAHSDRGRDHAVGTDRSPA